MSLQDDVVNVANEAEAAVVKSLGEKAGLSPMEVEVLLSLIAEATPFVARTIAASVTKLYNFVAAHIHR